MWKQFVVIISALAALGAVFGVVALATSGGGKVAAESAPAGPIGTPQHLQPQSTEQYWTPDRLAAAKPMERTRDDGVEPQSNGTSILDFTRSRITPQTANKQPPYKGAGKLVFTEPGVGDFECTASIIGKRLIVTAGHCMYGSGHYFENFLFIPGFDGSKGTLSAQRPFGAWNGEFVLVPTNWKTSSSLFPNDYDFGIIQLADQSFGGKLTTVFGKVKFKFETAVGHLFDTAVSMLGYPGNLDSGEIMQRVDSSDHRKSGVAEGKNGDTAYEYGSDMKGGSSGGPWVENLGNPASEAPQGSFNVRNTVVAVTSYGPKDPSSPLLYQGASQFNADFTAIKTTMCSFTAGNC